MLDFIIILIYSVILVLRVITLPHSTSISQRRTLVAANYMYGLNTMCLTLRFFGSVLESSQSTGVVQIALFKITGHIVIIFWQFLVATLAFSLAITKVSMTERWYADSEEKANEMYVI